MAQALCYGACMKRIGLLLLFCACACLSSCRQRHVKTVKITVPEMRNEACVVAVSNALRRVPGLLTDRIEFDLNGRTVSVPYDSLKLARKNIEFSIVNAGFATEEVIVATHGTVTNRIPANPKAVKRLPPGCLSQGG